MGLRNFAFCVMDKKEDGSEEVLHWELIDLQSLPGISVKSPFSQSSVVAYMAMLDSFQAWWERSDIILIERQVRLNPKAQRLSYHCLSYFLFRYGLTKTIEEYSAKKKTHVFSESYEAFLRGRKNTKPLRKKWAMQEIKAWCQSTQSLEVQQRWEELRKQDDVSDCVLMCRSYGIKNR